jgi:hypothetical protein
MVLQQGLHPQGAVQEGQLVGGLLDLLRGGLARPVPRARQQLSSFLLRHDRKWPGKTSWTDKHLIWIRGQRFAIEAQQQGLADYVREVERQTQRLAEATAQVEALAPETKPCARLYHCLQAMRGVGITAATLVAELGDLSRFNTASRLMSTSAWCPASARAVEANQLASHGDDCGLRSLATPGPCPVAAVQPLLCFPGDVGA